MSLALLRIAMAVAGVALAVLTSPPGGAPAAEAPGSCHANGGGSNVHGCLEALKGSVREVVGDDVELPNLVPAVTFTEVGYWYDFDDNGELVRSPPNVRFSVSVRNEGDFAMDLLGDPGADLTSTTVQQCVSWTERVCRERVQVGGFMWHPQHNHFHFQDFATYELRNLDGTGHVDRSPSGLIEVAPKVSFCLMDSETDDNDAPPPFYVQCLGANQGISPRWSDVYSNILPGQGLEIDGLPDADYAILVRLDPSNRLYESNDTDNEAAVVFRLSGNGTQAQLLGPAPG